METHKLIVILDPAHGTDTMGKASPDGLHRECVWSRHICGMLKEALQARGFDVHYTNTQDTEIGLTKRRRIADGINIPAGCTKFLLSLHNNAAGSEGKWLKATGFEIWTSQGRTISDKFAGIILQNLEKDFPQYKSRGLKESNFTVLMGSTYAAALVEWMFQDSKADVEILRNDQINRAFVNSLVNALEEIDKTLQP